MKRSLILLVFLIIYQFKVRGQECNSYLDFYGLKDYVEVYASPTIYNLQSGTVSIRFRMNDLGQAAMLFGIAESGKQGFSSNQFYIVYRTNQIQVVGIADGRAVTDVYTDKNTITDKNWHNVTVVADNMGEIEIYVDGQLKSLTTGACCGGTKKDFFFGDAVNADNIKVGALGRDTIFSKGTFSIDELRIWDKSFTLEEVNKQINSNETIHSSYLKLHYSFDYFEDLTIGNGGLNDIRDLAKGNHGDYRIGNQSNLSFENHMTFNGVKDYVEVYASPTIYDLQSGTVSFWFKMNDLDQAAMLFGTAESGKQGFSSNQFYIVYRTNQIQVVGIAGGRSVTDVYTDKSTITDKNWHNVTVVADNLGEIEVYVDGQLKSLTTGACCGGTKKDFFFGDAVNADNIKVGALGRDTIFSKGTFSIDELRIWDKPLCIGEINNNIFRPLIPSEPNLILYYTFDKLENLKVGYPGLNDVRDKARTNHGDYVLEKSFTCNFNNRLSFKDGDSYVDIHAKPSIYNLQKGTVSMWFKIDDLNKNVILFGSADSKNTWFSSDGFFVSYRNDMNRRIEVAGLAGGKAVLHAHTEINTINDNNWHNLSIVADNIGEIEVYVDGKLRNLVAGTCCGGTIKDFFFAHAVNANNIKIGALGRKEIIQHGSFSINEFKIYNTPLRAEEINNIFNCSHNFSSIGLELYYSFEKLENLSIGRSGVNDIRDHINGNHGDYIQNNINNTIGMIACYNFNGTANDDSENKLDGEVNGATLTTDRFGNFNSAYYFDGVDDFISVKDTSLLDVDNISISIWAKPGSFASRYSGVISKTRPNVDNQGGFCTSTNDKSLRLSAQFENGIYNQPYISGEVDLNQWQHFVFIINNGVLKIYKNGIKVLEDTSQIGKKLSKTEVPLLFGKTYWFPGYQLNEYYFHGSIDDICIYNRGLTESEINSLSSPIITEIDRIENQSEILDIYPNPSLNGIFTIEKKIQDEFEEMELYNSVGEIIYNVKSSNVSSIDLSTHAKGFYVLKVKLKSGTVIKKPLINQ